MDLINAIRFYVDRLVSDRTANGMKVLLLDEATTQIVAMVYSQTQVLEKEVYLVERLDAEHERMMHLKAVMFVRPTQENLQRIRRELRDPKYAEYHLFFSNVVPQDYLARLAEADEHEVVRQVQEFYGDYLAVNPDLFDLNLRHGLLLSADRDERAMPPAVAEMFHRSVDGVLSLLLSLRRQPAQVRYQGSSELARRVATEISSRMAGDTIFHFQGPQPTLLILDRRDDPVTPLLTQWTYQAMVHELLGLHNARVDLRNAPGIQPDMHEVVLSVTQDDFFRANVYSNFGDLGAAVKTMLEEYQARVQSNSSISSIEDMQRFLNDYPAFRSQSLNVSKHVAVMSELARLVDRFALMDVSALEQELACTDAHSDQLAELNNMINNPAVQGRDKLRLAMLYALRYERHSSNQLDLIKTRLRDAGVPVDDVRAIDALMHYAGAAKRGGELYGGRSLTDRISSALTGGLNDAVNVYSQHNPPLMHTLDALSKGRLKENVFPSTRGGASRDRATDVIVFIVGGATYEEAAKVAELNAADNGLNVLLGGTCIHNSVSFIQEVMELYNNRADRAAFGRM